MLFRSSLSLLGKGLFHFSFGGNGTRFSWLSPLPSTTTIPLKPCQYDQRISCGFLCRLVALKGVKGRVTLQVGCAKGRSFLRGVRKRSPCYLSIFFLKKVFITLFLKYEEVEKIMENTGLAPIFFIYFGWRFQPLTTSRAG